MIIDKATTCYVVAVLAACTTVVVVHDGYLSHRPSPSARPAQPEGVQGNSSLLPIPSVTPPPQNVPQELRPPALAVFSLPDAADDPNAERSAVPPGDYGVVKPFRIVRNRPCRTSPCAAWTAIDLDTGKKSGAVVDLAPLNLAPAIASPARKGIVDLLITAEALPDSEEAEATLHLRAIKLEGVAPHRLAFRAPPASRPATGIVRASLPDSAAPNGF